MGVQTVQCLDCGCKSDVLAYCVHEEAICLPLRLWQSTSIDICICKISVAIGRHLQSHKAGHIDQRCQWAKSTNSNNTSNNSINSNWTVFKPNSGRIWLVIFASLKTQILHLIGLSWGGIVASAIRPEMAIPVFFHNSATIRTGIMLLRFVYRGLIGWKSIRIATTLFRVSSRPI